MLDWHPHVYAIATRGGWDAAGRFVPMPFVSTAGAEQLFRHQVITLLRDEGLLTEERIELLMSWRHSGFSAHNAVTVPPGDTGGIERLGGYLLRAPASLQRLELDLEGRSVRYRAKSRGARVGGKTFEVTEFLARLLQHVPEPRLHQVRYYGYYSNGARARRSAGEGGEVVAADSEVPEPGAAERRRLRRSWAQLIRRIYEVDPLTCTDCGGRMRIIAFLMDPAVVRKILDHWRRPAAHPPLSRRRTRSGAGVGRSGGVGEGGPGGPEQTRSKHLGSKSRVGQRRRSYGSRPANC